jgi:hypothetical protein
MTALALAIFLAVGLGMGKYYYGLGDLTEDGYLRFTKLVMFKELFIAMALLMIPLFTISALAMMVSSLSNTMGGAMILGIISYFFFNLVGMIPNTLGLTIASHFIPYSLFGFPILRFVPLYILDDLPAGIPIDSWWVADIQKMTITCGIYFAIFLAVSLVIIKRRDFTI